MIKDKLFSIFEYNVLNPVCSPGKYQTIFSQKVNQLQKKYSLSWSERNITENSVFNNLMYSHSMNNKIITSTLVSQLVNSSIVGILECVKNRYTLL